MAAVNSLLLLLTTLAPNTFPPDGQPATYTPPPEWNTYDSPVEIIEEYDVLPPCTPVIPPVGEMQCPPNSHYKPCGPVCPRSCIRYHCPLNCCVEGCFCDEGYVMGYNGSCIREEECRRFSDMDLPYQAQDTPDEYPSECGPNEYIGCDHQSERNCSNYRYLMAPRSEPCTLGCVCIPPMIRGPGGYCILPEQCPSTPITDAFARDWTICNFMRVINPDADCPLSARQCEDPESCIFDYFNQKNHHVNRIQAKQCEDPESCIFDYFNQKNNHVNRIEAKQCEDPESCIFDYFNQKNYLVNRTAVGDEMKPCYPDQKLPEGSLDCEATEQYHECAPICFPTCTAYYCPLSCCVPGCYCPKGYVRGPRGICIPEDECPVDTFSLSNKIQDTYDPAPVSCSPDEIISCDSHCQLNCSNYYSEFTPCPDDTCVLGCVCKPPKIRGPDGDCILPEQCHPRSLNQPDEISKMDMMRNFLHIRQHALQQSSAEGPLFKCRKKHEYLNLCTYTCPDTCDDYKDKSRICKKVCLPIPRCDCEEGYVRGPSGDCITPEECPNEAKPAVCPENEEWQFCGTACPKNCTNYDKPIPCIKNCTQGCFCKEPRVRGPDGSCVFVEECPRIMNASAIAVCPENEEWQFCGTACPKDCTNYDKNIQCIQMCSTGCFCKEPRVRGPDGTCILIEECPARLDASPACPENEYYVECQADCEMNCTNYDQNFACSTVCKSGCICKPPLVRGPDFTCVRVEECTETTKQQRNWLKSVGQFPAQVCGENERFSFCKSICPDNCKNYLEERFCKHVCLPGCACLPGYVLSRDGVCIKQEHCVEDRPEDCSELETYNDCGSHCEVDCFNFNMASRDCYTKECRKGCFCKPGWVRSSDMKCIRPYECPRQSRISTRRGGREWPL